MLLLNLQLKARCMLLRSLRNIFCSILALLNCIFVLYNTDDGYAYIITLMGLSQRHLRAPSISIDLSLAWNWSSADSYALFKEMASILHQAPIWQFFTMWSCNIVVIVLFSLIRAILSQLHEIAN